MLVRVRVQILLEAVVAVRDDQLRCLQKEIQTKHLTASNGSVPTPNPASTTEQETSNAQPGIAQQATQTSDGGAGAAHSVSAVAVPARQQGVPHTRAPALDQPLPPLRSVCLSGHMSDLAM